MQAVASVVDSKVSLVEGEEFAAVEHVTKRSHLADLIPSSLKSRKAKKSFFPVSAISR